MPTVNLNVQVWPKEVIQFNSQRINWIFFKVSLVQPLQAHSTYAVPVHTKMSCKALWSTTSNPRMLEYSLWCPPDLMLLHPLGTQESSSVNLDREQSYTTVWAKITRNPFTRQNCGTGNANSFIFRPGMLLNVIDFCSKTLAHMTTEFGNKNQNNRHTPLQTATKSTTAIYRRCVQNAQFCGPFTLNFNFLDTVLISGHLNI